MKYNSEREMTYRLNRLSEPSKSGTTFEFPWGRVEYLSASDLRGQFSEIFLDRHYAIRSEIADPCIIDAGGNIGMSAIWFKQNYPSGKITVYEADPHLAKVLRRNLESAKLSGVEVHNAAAWTFDGTVAFDNRGLDKGAVRETGSISVPAIDLSAHLPKRVDLLKLDVEGAEYSIISRLCETKSISRVQNLVAEFHVTRVDTDRAITSLSQLRAAGMQVCFTSALGPWLGRSDLSSAFELVGEDQMLMEVYAWR